MKVKFLVFGEIFLVRQNIEVFDYYDDLFDWSKKEEAGKANNGISTRESEVYFDAGGTGA